MLNLYTISVGLQMALHLYIHTQNCKTIRHTTFTIQAYTNTWDIRLGLGKKAYMPPHLNPDHNIKKE